MVFKNGASISFSLALADRKKKWFGPLSADRPIKDCFFIRLDGTDCIAMVAEMGKVILMHNLHFCHVWYFFVSDVIFCFRG